MKNNTSQQDGFCTRSRVPCHKSCLTVTVCYSCCRRQESFFAMILEKDRSCVFRCVSSDRPYTCKVPFRNWTNTCFHQCCLLLLVGRIRSARQMNIAVLALENFRLWSS